MAVIQTESLEKFAARHHLHGLTESSLRAIVEHRPGYSVGRAKRFLEFQWRIDEELLQHRVITRNSYTIWFSQGRQTSNQVRDFIIQFSVFSNQFLVAQLYKMINADSLTCWGFSQRPRPYSRLMIIWMAWARRSVASVANEQRSDDMDRGIMPVIRVR